MLQLANEFSYLQLPPGGGASATSSSSSSRQQRGGGSGGRGVGDEHTDLKMGAPFTPSYVYQILASIKSDSAFNVEGRQEDAEEFLTFLLNGLNDEMLELLKSVQSKDSPSESGHQEGGKQKANNSKGSSNQSNSSSSSSHSHAPATTGLTNGTDMMNGTDVDGDDGDWKEVTKESKNKGSIVRRHTSVLDKTPVSEIFRGQVRTRVTRVSDSSTTENIQPFFTLALDIEKVSSVKEALDQLVLRDSIEGVTSTKTNQETEAYQTVTIEELPFVLLLHLKCFDYKSDTCHKIQKALEFPVVLSLEPKLLSSGKSKKLGGPLNGPKNKQYKLFAVVYHDGKEASKGHYITDVFHVGYSGWIRYDDANVRFVSDQEVLHPRPPRVPYILYYRRADTIVPKNLSPNS
uniref:ubiquitinyl hydrolase 1 n=3 Tax=Cacopsylla melanoneura TaxID=428564 RepID=A0A8D8TKP5_9HEMI